MFILSLSWPADPMVWLYFCACYYFGGKQLPPEIGSARPPIMTTTVEVPCGGFNGALEMARSIDMAGKWKIWRARW